MKALRVTPGYHREPDRLRYPTFLTLHNIPLNLKAPAAFFT